MAPLIVRSSLAVGGRYIHICRPVGLLGLLPNKVSRSEFTAWAQQAQKQAHRPSSFLLKLAVSGGFYKAAKSRNTVSLLGEKNTRFHFHLGLINSEMF